MTGRRIFLICFLLLIFFVPFMPTHAQERIPVLLFYGRECPHCEEELAFFRTYLESYPDTIDLQTFEVWHDPQNRVRMQTVADALHISAGAVPLTVIGEKYIVGFETADTTGSEIIRIIHNYHGPEYASSIRLPVFGTFDLSTVSIPLFSVLVGLVDGFNPCAMWSLVALLGILMAFKNRQRLIVLGSVFLISSAAIYFAFLAAWLHVMLFVGSVYAIRIGIGIAAVCGGIYALYRFFTKPKGVCDISKTQSHKKAFERARDLITHPSMFFALAGVVVAAVLVNIVELLCSVGLPVVYTNALALQNISGISRYLNLLLYTISYMLDDIIVFLLAVWTSKITSIGGTYSKYSPFVGGILLLALGIFLIL